MKGLSTCSTSVSSLNQTASVEKNSSAIFSSRSAIEVSVESPQLKSQDSEQCFKKRSSHKSFLERERQREQEITKELEDIIIGEFGISIDSNENPKIKLMQILIDLLNQIESQVNPIELCYDEFFFQKKDRDINKSIKDNDLSPYQIRRRKSELLLDEIKEILNIDLTRGNSFIQILSAACDHLHDYLKQASAHVEEESEKREGTDILPLGTLLFDEIPFHSTQVKKDYSSSMKRNKNIRITNNVSSKELEDILFGKLDVDIVNYANSKIKLIDATIFIINQIKEQVEPINFVYSLDHFRERNRQVMSSIEKSGLSRFQLIRRKHDLLLSELKSVLDIDIDINENKDIVYKKIVSEACNYLNGYLNQTGGSTTEVSSAIESTDSSSVSPTHYADSVAQKTSIIFTGLSTSQVSVNSTRVKKDDSKTIKGHKNFTIKENQAAKKLEDILFCKLGVNIINYRNSRIKLIDTAIFIIEQIKNQVDQIKLIYDTYCFQKRSSQLTSSIAETYLSPYQLNCKRHDLLLSKLKSLLDIDETKNIVYEQIVSEACNYLNSYLNRMSDSTTEVSGAIGSNDSSSVLPTHYTDSVATNDSAPFLGLTTSQVPASSTRVKKDNSKKIKRKRGLKIKKDQSAKELEDILFGKFGVNIINYGNSKKKLIDVTIFIVKQIKEQVNPIRLVYDTDYFQERSHHLISKIKERGLSPNQLTRRQHDLLFRELKSVLDIDSTKDIVDEQILSEARNYLNDYLKQTSLPLEEALEKAEPTSILQTGTLSYSDDDEINVPNSTQPVEPQPLSQSSMPVIRLPVEEELTTEEELSLIRLKMALNRYPIPQIENGNFGELLFAAAYCIKMNSNMIQISELGYNQHYVKNFHAPYPYNNCRDEIEDYLDDLEKALSEESMNLAIKQCLNHQKDTLPETSYLENTGLDSLMDTLEPEALFTTGSLNHTLGHGEGDTDSAQVQKITAALELAAQYLENKEYLKLQNSLAHEEMIEDEPVAKKIKV